MQRNARAMMRRWVLALASVPVALVTVLLPPAPPPVKASGCGGTDGPLCYVYTECSRFLLWRKCTTTYGYYPEFL